MKTPTITRSAIVADDRPLMRDLLRFALDELGFVTAGQVSTGVAAIDAAAEHHPDVLILHEGAGLGALDVIERIRSVSPNSKVVVLTTDRAETPAALTASADAVVEEGAGLQDLPLLLGARTGATVHGRRRTWPVHRRWGPQGERWLKRVQGAVAASILLIGLMLIFPASGFAGGLAAAHESLVHLADELPDATPEEAVSLATTLVSQRAILLSREVDVSGLDAQIADRLGPLLPSLPTDVAQGLTGVLGVLVTVETTSPPAPAPQPPPAETPGPSAPSPEPTVTTSPTPDDPASPTPGESPSPDPTETPSPDPTETQSPPVETPGDVGSPSPAAPS